MPFGGRPPHHVFLLRGKKPWIPELRPLAGLGHDAKTKTSWFDKCLARGHGGRAYGDMVDGLGVLVCAGSEVERCDLEGAEKDIEDAVALGRFEADRLAGEGIGDEQVAVHQADPSV